MTLFDRLRRKYGGTEWCDPIIDEIRAAPTGAPLPDWLLVERTLGGYQATWFDTEQAAVDVADLVAGDGELVNIGQLLRGEP